MLTSVSYCQKGSFKGTSSNVVEFHETVSHKFFSFSNYKTRKYLLKHHKLGPVQTLVTVEIYRQELGQE